MTAYRQDAIKIARYLLVEGQGKPAQIRDMLDMPKTRNILADNHYGWFFRVERGVSALSDAGVEAINAYSDD